MSNPLEDTLKEFKTNYYNFLQDSMNLLGFVANASNDFKHGFVNEAKLEKTLRKFEDDFDRLTTKAIEVKADFQMYKWERERAENHGRSVEEIFKNHINGKPNVE